MSQNNLEEKNKKVYELMYQNPDSNLAYEVKDKITMFNCVQKYLGEIKGKRVLDVGFGTGEILLSLSKKGAFCFGVEIASSAIKRLEERTCSKIKLLKWDNKRLPFKNDHFDIVICSHVFEHIAFPEKLLGEIERVLKDSGFMVVGVPGFEPKLRPLHFRSYTEGALMELLKGWKIVHLKTFRSKIFRKILDNVRKTSSVYNKNVELDRAGAGNKALFFSKIQIIKKTYYKLIVPFILLLLKLDSCLNFVKLEPLDIWCVARKNK